MKPRVLLSSGNYRIVDRGSDHWKRFVIEEGGDYDHMGVRQWNEISFERNVHGQKFLKEDVFNNIIDEIGKVLRRRELRARGRRRELTLRQRIAAKKARKDA